MKTTLLCLTQTTGSTGAPRPYALAPMTLAPTTAVRAITASWSAIVRKSMNVPAFHDRWPLCSST